MTIPFLNFFKKKSVSEQPAAAVAPLPPVEKPSSDRLSKTVMPNAVRTMSSHDSFAGSSMSSPAVATAPVGHRTIAFGPGPSERQANLPPAVALALEPRVERAISLELADVVRHLPEGLVRPLGDEDGGRRVLLKASELEKGMARGRPSVSLSTIFQQVPEIFSRQIASSDSTQVQLPFDKVLEQFSNLQVRPDQHRAQAVPQVQTPFLKVTLEDDVKFGTKTEVIETTYMPSVRLEPATAESIAAAEPEPAPASRIPIPATPPPSPFPLRPAAPAEPKANGTNGHGHAAPSVEAKAAPAPARIPFKLTPNGTDEPAPERVPASSGPSVPTSTPPAAAPAAPPAPARIPFKVTAPSEDARPPAEPWLTKESFATQSDVAAAAPIAAPEPEPVKSTAPVVALALKPILQSLPPFQLTGDLDAVANDARVELPFALIEPQLASGKVVVKPSDFAQALPAEYRALFDASDATATVSLPLQEVLKNLPSATLRMRDDQVEQEKGGNFATPFSAKADEDAKRFKVAGTPVEKPVAGAVPAPAPAPAPVAPPVGEPEPVAATVAEPVPMAAPAPIAMPAIAAPAPAVTAPANVVPDVADTEEKAKPKKKSAKVAAGRSALQTALETDDELDAKAVVAHVGKMAGVKACAIMFGDGLSLAGNLPEEYEADGLCAMAPSLLQRIENHMVETKLGALRAVTLSCSKAAVTFFMHDNLCLAALHSKDQLASDVRERLARAVHELSKTFSNPV